MKTSRSMDAGADGPSKSLDRSPCRTGSSGAPVAGRRPARVLRLLLPAAVIVLSCGDPCDPCPSQPEPPAHDVTGTWSGEARILRDQPYTAGLELTLVQIDTLVVGRLNFLDFMQTPIRASSWQGDTLSLIIHTETGREVAFRAWIQEDTLTGWWWYEHGIDHPGLRWWNAIRYGGLPTPPSGGGS